MIHMFRHQSSLSPPPSPAPPWPGPPSTARPRPPATGPALPAPWLAAALKCSSQAPAHHPLRGPQSSLQSQPPLTPPPSPSPWGAGGPGGWATWPRLLRWPPTPATSVRRRRGRWRPAANRAPGGGGRPTTAAPPALSPAAAAPWLEDDNRAFRIIQSSLPNKISILANNL